MKVGIATKKETAETQVIVKQIKLILHDLGLKVDLSYFHTSVAEDSQDWNASYQRLKKLILTNDFIVAEMTEYSLEVGFLVADALNNRKPVLVLFNKNNKGNKQGIAGLENSKHSKLMEYVEYAPEDLAKVIEKFVDKAKKLSENKYILLLPAEIDQYLDWASYTYHQPKSQIVREAINSKMKKNKEWQESMQSGTAKAD